MTMLERFGEDIERLKSSSNYRSIPSDGAEGLADFTSNDYLGIASRDDLRDEFYASAQPWQLSLTSSASRLLALRQRPYFELESYLESLYGRPALLFNSGYHANTGIVSAVADSRTMIIADRLAHASIIDGIKLSKGNFTRFHHNDFLHLVRLIEKYYDDFDTILVIVESVYSMDGDKAEIDCLIDIKRKYPKVMLYVDEAHAFGVEGRQGLGLVADSVKPSEVDIVVGTLGKAAASSGAFAIVNTPLKQYLVNHSRSLIFSTAIAPVNVAWSRFIIERMLGMDAERGALRRNAERLSAVLSEISSFATPASHIQPLVIGDAAATLALSKALEGDGVKVLPIRTPTVPPGTERLRFSLSSTLTESDIERVKCSLMKHYGAVVGKR